MNRKARIFYGITGMPSVCGSSAKRVMRTVSDWIQRKLGLKVNMTKTHITRPLKLKYLGCGFYKDSKTIEWKCRPHQDSVKKFKDRLKKLTCREVPGIVMSEIEKINQATRGGLVTMPLAL